MAEKEQELANDLNLISPQLERLDATISMQKTSDQTTPPISNISLDDSYEVQPGEGRYAMARGILSELEAKDGTTLNQRNIAVLAKALKILQGGEPGAYEKINIPKIVAALDESGLLSILKNFDPVVEQLRKEINETSTFSTDKEKIELNATFEILEKLAATFDPKPALHASVLGAIQSPLEHLSSEVDPPNEALPKNTKIKEESKGSLTPASKTKMTYSKINEHAEVAARIASAAYEINDLHPAHLGGWAIAESSGRPRVVSTAGARGLMQIKVATAREEAEKITERLRALGEQGKEEYDYVIGLGLDNFNEAMLFDPEINMILGAGYGTRMRIRYGNWPEAETAYNMGSTRYNGIRKKYETSEKAQEYSRNRKYSQDIEKYTQTYFAEYYKESEQLLANRD